MANIKSAQKRIRVHEKRAMRNKHIKSTTKTAVKKVVAADKANAQMLLRNAIAAIDKAASKGVYHKNTAARKKSRLTKMVNRKAQ